MLFKALVIQSLYNLSDDQLEYQIVDRAGSAAGVKAQKNSHS